VDLFGLVTYDFSWNVGTGQVLEEIAEHADVISLMVYPSHYGRGNYGLLPHPIEYPYETVWNAMQEAQMRTQGLHAKLRPWLEDFPAPWMGYPTTAPSTSEEQIRATYENGIEGWLLWNAANRYPRRAGGRAGAAANPDFRPPARTANPDPPPGEEQQTWPGMPPCGRTPTSSRSARATSPARSRRSPRCRTTTRACASACRMVTGHGDLAGAPTDGHRGTHGPAHGRHRAHRGPTD
jgi:hypothetical protein